MRVPGDVADEAHRLDLAAAVDALGGDLDLLVHNASLLGPSPQPPVSEYPLPELERVYAANVFGPLRLTQLLLPCMGPGARIVSITSDAAVEAYEGWGGYGSSKAALEQWTKVLAAERPDLRVYVVDPGDMRTQMHQDAFPGEDISDRPLPETSVPGLLTVIEGDLPSGRYEARTVGADGADHRGGVVSTLTAPAFELPDELIAESPPEARGTRPRRGTDAGGVARHGRARRHHVPRPARRS